MISETGSGRVSSWKLWTCNTRVGSGRGAHNGNCGRIIPGARIDMVVSPLSLWTVSTGMGQGEGVTLETGNVTRGSKSGSGGHHG